MADTAEQVARFLNAQRRAGPEGKHLAQGMLTYPRENAVNRLTWLADAIRPVDDIARFAVLTGGGTPLAGLHGELLLRASIEATIGWDFGPDSICEDAHLALVFASRHKGPQRLVLLLRLRCVPGDRARLPQAAGALVLGSVCRAAPGRCSCTA
ncbi:MAG: hypothetical protein JF621_27905 [Streptomyces turgidiscabies]|nr:hypothetical protein [Streptomyces turgidiscabies]